MICRLGEWSRFMMLLSILGWFATPACTEVSLCPGWWLEYHHRGREHLYLSRHDALGEQLSEYAPGRSN